MRQRMPSYSWSFGLLFLVTSCTQEQTPSKGSGLSDSSYQLADIYSDLRSQALEYRPQEGLESTDQVVSVPMETGYPEAVATLVAVSDGAVSIYFSNGGGIIGAGEHEPVRRIAKEFLSLAATFLNDADLVESFALPEPSRVRFFFVTSGGTYMVDALEDDLGYNRHDFSPLFQQGHELITAIREHAE